MMTNLVSLFSQLEIVLAMVLAIALGAVVAVFLVGRSGRAARDQADLAYRQRAADFEQEIVSLRERVIMLDAQQVAKDEQLALTNSESQNKERRIEGLQHQLLEKGAELGSLRTELGLQKEIVAEKIKTLEETRQQLGKEFELLANRIFEEKTERFNKNSRSTLDSAITPLRDQLKEFKQRVDDVHDKDNKERASLSAELDQLKKLNQQMSVDAHNLTSALKGDNKTQGNWGEVILERVLEESGLTKGREYDTQVNLKSEQGRSQPDVIVRLPENKDLVIDSKVSLVHYERYCKADDGDEKSSALKAHIASVKTHIKDLSTKNYEGLEGLRTLDFVLIFIPIESAFMAAFEHDQSMFRDAYEKNIIVVGPTTLLATLRTIQSIWRYERQNKHAEEIARQAGAMHDKFVGFVADLDKIAEHLSRAGLAHESAMNKLVSGKGNLVGSTQRLEKLGAKVKKSMPDSVSNVDDLELSIEFDNSQDQSN